MLSMTKFQLELASDPGMNLFFEKDMRGGVSNISKRYNKSNNKHLKPYDQKQDSKHIMETYLDANNLFGHAAWKYLPIGGFKWIDPKNSDLKKCNKNSSKDCALEVDVECQKKLCELHTHYPLALDKTEIKKEMLSKYQLLIADSYNTSTGNVKKMVPNFLDKEKYVLHYKNFHVYLRLRLKQKKVHRVLELNESQWLKPYVECNTQERTEASKNRDKDGKVLHKLMNNAEYGKTMENLRNWIDVKLVSNEKDYLKWTSKPSCRSQKIFGNDLVATRKIKIALIRNKSAYVGMFILEVSKVLMYEFHYN